MISLIIGLLRDDIRLFLSLFRHIKNGIIFIVQCFLFPVIEAGQSAARHNADGHDSFVGVAAALALLSDEKAVNAVLTGEEVD